MCSGCGHNSISRHIIDACFEAQIPPHQIVKLSGIGCSSKTPNYFLQKSHGFNGIHGRMAAIAMGVKLANHKLHVLGVSGDGDTLNIGLGGFLHSIRKQIPMVYLIENNGVYGLTKGQHSASHECLDNNHFSPIDICSLAVQMGASFVARAFSGDRKQTTTILKAAFKHGGVCVIDIISPCVVYADQDHLTKSYPFLKKHNYKLHEMEFYLKNNNGHSTGKCNTNEHSNSEYNTGKCNTNEHNISENKTQEDKSKLLQDFVIEKKEIQEQIPEGAKKTVTFHDGSQIVLHKIKSDEYDITNSDHALQHLQKLSSKKQVSTGIFFVKKNISLSSSVWT